MSGVAVLAAGYHALAIIAPSLGIEGAIWRHALFIGVNLLCAALVLRRPPWFVFAVAALTLQQLQSHGSHLMRLWAAEGRIHWLSLAPITLLPVTLALLIQERRAIGSGRTSASPSPCGREISRPPPAPSSPPPDQA
jgi:hypothetical protein